MPRITLALHAMATRFEIVLHGDQPAALRAAGEEALEEIERLEAQLSLFRASSEIAHLNARAAKEPVRVTPGLFALLHHAQTLHTESDGAFDITIAPLVRCWGFRDGTGHIPDPKALSEARQKVGMSLVHLELKDFTVRFAREGVMLDLGAIGKGYAIERAAEILHEAGVTSALLHGGTSTVQAIGHPPDAETWKVAVAYPQLESTPNLKTPEVKEKLRAGYSPERLTILPLPDGLSGSDGPRIAKRSISMGQQTGGGLGKPLGRGEGERSGYSSSPARSGSAESAGPALLATVELNGEAMSVSGIRGKFFQAGGRTFGHILDPRTGQPATGAVLAVVVLPSATESDALSTALLTLGPQGHNKISTLRPGIRTLVAAEANGRLKVEARGITWNDE